MGIGVTAVSAYRGLAVWLPALRLSTLLLAWLGHNRPERVLPASKARHAQPEKAPISPPIAAPWS